MRNFLIKSKDMFAQEPNRYKSFAKVFELIRDMNVAKSYYEADLFNIEDIPRFWRCVINSAASEPNDSSNI